MGGIGGSLGDPAVGGNFGIGGDAGVGGFGGTFGGGGYYGDAGRPPFGGTAGSSGGGAGGTRCNADPWMNAKCTPTQGCIDPYSPTPEHVRLNQRVSVDAGVTDAGISTERASEPPSMQVRGTPVRAMLAQPMAPCPRLAPRIGVDICGGNLLTPSTAHLAFDVWSEHEVPLVGIYSVNQMCSGAMLGVPQFQYSPPPVHTWTSQCIDLPYKFLERVMVRPMSPGTFVSNLRFVAECVCPRPLTIFTNCGPEGGLDAGLCVRVDPMASRASRYRVPACRFFARCRSR